MNGIKQPTTIFIAGPWEGQAQWANFIDWSQNLRIVLKEEKKLEVFEHPLPNEPARNAIAAQRELFEKKKNESNDVTCLMLATISPELQKQFMDMEAYEIMTHLKEMF